jgi:resuscitation-promoting factor RpfB
MAGLLLVFSAFTPNNATAANDFIVSIHADSYTRNVRTEGGTVGELLNRAGVIMNENDLVEPEVNTVMHGPVYNINIYRARPVLVKDESSEYVISSPYSSSRLIAEHAGLEVYPEDILDLKRVDDFVGAGIIGEQLSITRAMPLVIDLYGRRINHRTHKETVRETLIEKNIYLDDEDMLLPTANTELASGMVVRIIRVGVKVVIEEKVITHRNEFIWDDNLQYGVEIIEQVGVDGEEVATYEIEYHNEKEVSRHLLNIVSSIDPLAHIVRVGTKESANLDNVSIAETLARSKGWIGQQWICLNNLWEKESHWNQYAQNPITTAYGIAQFLDGTWYSTGYIKTSDPTTQILAGFVYIENRYGSPCSAWQHSINYNWY